MREVSPYVAVAPLKRLSSSAVTPLPQPVERSRVVSPPSQASDFCGVAVRPEAMENCTQQGAKIELASARSALGSREEPRSDTKSTVTVFTQPGQASGGAGLGSALTSLALPVGSSTSAPL